LIQAYPGYHPKLRFELSNDLKAEKPIYFICLNPSTADSNSFDPTSRSCHKLTDLLGVDAWSILNLYPQRAVSPYALHKRVNTKLFEENIAFVRKKLIQKNDNTKVVLSWGNAVRTRGYLKRAARLLIDEILEHQLDCLHMGLTSKQQPIHPSPQALLRKYRSYSKVELMPFSNSELTELKSTLLI
jgi:hypothetical protein